MENILTPLPQKFHVLNSVVDSLFLRVSRFASPSPWLQERLAAWREYHQNSEPGDEWLVIELPGLGSFSLKPRKDRHYEFVLVNPEIGDIKIYNPDKWPKAIAGQQGQFYVMFRSKFLQFHSHPGVRAFVKALTSLFCSEFDSAAGGWERVSRADLAADMQMPLGYQWQDLDRFVAKARWKEIDSDSSILLEEINEILSAPPSDNKGGATYNVSADLLAKVSQALESSRSDDGYLYRVIAKRDPQTLYFGRFKSPLYARLYDKLASLDRQQKGYMRDVWTQSGWDGNSPVWRHEFSLSADFLEAIANLETGEVEDLRDYELFLTAIPRLWRYLTDEWLRFTEPEPGDSNRWRWKLDDGWAVLQMAFASPTSIARRRPPRQPVEEQLKAQMLGVALTLAAKRARSDTDSYSWQSVAADFFDWMDSSSFFLDLKKRRQILGVDDFSDTALSAFYRAEWMAEGFGS